MCICMAYSAPSVLHLSAFITICSQTDYSWWKLIPLPLVLYDSIWLTGRGWFLWWLWDESPQLLQWRWRMALLSELTTLHKIHQGTLHTASPVQGMCVCVHISGYFCSNNSLSPRKQNSEIYHVIVTCKYVTIFTVQGSLSCYGSVLNVQCVLDWPASWTQHLPCVCRLWVCRWLWSRRSSPSLPPNPTHSRLGPLSAGRVLSTETPPVYMNQRTDQ